MDARENLILTLKHVSKLDIHVEPMHKINFSYILKESFTHDNIETFSLCMLEKNICWNVSH